MKSYSDRYEDFTLATVKLAEQIHNANQNKISDTRYSLPKITLALRNIYKNPVFHEQFVSSKMSDNKWSSGFCALASVVIYEIYGGDKVWNLMAIRPNVWSGGPVVFLQDKTTGLNFGTIGEYFYPEIVPYELGKPLDTQRLKTPNKEAFKQILMCELARM